MTKFKKSKAMNKYEQESIPNNIAVIIIAIVIIFILLSDNL